MPGAPCSGTAIRGCLTECGSGGQSPMTAAAAPVSAATKHQHDQNDNEDQFHENSPLMPTALFAAHPSSQRQLQSIVPGKSVSRQFALDRAAQMDRASGSLSQCGV